MKHLGSGFNESFRKALGGLRWRLHSKFPSVILDSSENRAFRRSKDAEENAQSKVPVEEELRQAAIWGVELYGPKEVSALYENIEKLGWSGTRYGSPDSDVLEWLRRARQYGYVGSRNIGIVYHPKEKGVGRDYFAPVPSLCEYLLVSVNQITPSLTAVHVYFVLKEEPAKVYERILNTDRKSFYRRLEGQRGYSIPGVFNQKSEIIDRVREERKKIASSWFAEHLPGLFSGGALIDRLPTGEFIAMKNHVALKDPKDDDGEQPKWPYLLGVDRWFDGWLHPSYSGFGLILDGRVSGEMHHSIVAVTTELLPDEQFRFYGGRGWGAYNAIVYQELGGIAIRLAASDYLKEIGRRIRDARENIAQASKSRATLMVALDRLEAFYREAIGDPTISEELSELEKHHFNFDCAKFVSKTLNRDATIDLPTALHKITNRLGESVLAEGHSARQLFQEFASTLSARESIKAQRKMECLTVIAIVVAGIGVYFGASGK